MTLYLKRDERFEEVVQKITRNESWDQANAHFMVLGINSSPFLRKFGNKVLAKCNIWGYAILHVRQQSNVGEIESTNDLIFTTINYSLSTGQN